MSDMPTSSPEDTVVAYLKAYITPDASERQALLEQCCADDGVYRDPNMRVAGRANMLANIESFHKRLPGATFNWPVESMRIMACCVSGGPCSAQTARGLTSAISTRRAG
jgi:hypothetical protein